MNKEIKEKIKEVIKLLSENLSSCPRSLTLEKSYIIEQETIKKALDILKSIEE